MKAVVYRRFGSPDQLRCEDVARPEPGDDEVLVKVRMASVNPLDWHMLRGTPRLIRLSGDVRKYKPMRAGRDIAGVIEAIGSGVTRFKPGDSVFGASQGAFADYVCGSEKDFASKPAELSFEDAAALPIAGLTALQGLRDAGGLRAGQKVLINGASGGVGTFAVQLARILGAEVAATCSSDAVELVRGLGADEVFDYRSVDVTSGKGRYDLILDLVGNHPFLRLDRILASRGRVVAAGGGGRGGRRLGRWMIRTMAAVLASRFRSRKVVLCVSRMDIDDLATLAELVGSGRLRPVIDKSYRLNQVREALAYVSRGHARGKVIVRVAA